MAESMERRVGAKGTADQHPRTELRAGQRVVLVWISLRKTRHNCRKPHKIGTYRIFLALDRPVGEHTSSLIVRTRGGNRTRESPLAGERVFVRSRQLAFLTTRRRN